MPRSPRRQFLVNGKLQGSIAMRVGVYWLYCLLAVALTTSCWMVLFERPESSAAFTARLFQQVIPTLLASVLLLPMVLMDSVRFSNRFVGPIFRLGRSMERLADGERVHNIEFRENDFWFGFAQAFNRLNERVILLEERTKLTNEREPAKEKEEEPVAVG